MPDVEVFSSYVKFTGKGKNTLTNNFPAGEEAAMMLELDPVDYSHKKNFISDKLETSKTLFTDLFDFTLASTYLEKYAGRNHYGGYIEFFNCTVKKPLMIKKCAHCKFTYCDHVIKARKQCLYDGCTHKHMSKRGDFPFCSQHKNVGKNCSAAEIIEMRRVKFEDALNYCKENHAVTPQKLMSVLDVGVIPELAEIVSSYTGSVQCKCEYIVPSQYIYKLVVTFYEKNNSIEILSIVEDRGKGNGGSRLLEIIV